MSQLVKVHTYKLKTNDTPITLSITIGNDHSATTNLFLDGRVLELSLEDSFDEKVIGSNKKLHNRQLIISTNTFDINPETNQVSFRYKIKGGPKVLYPASLKMPVDEKGIANFTIQVIFV